MRGSGDRRPEELLEEGVALLGVPDPGRACALLRRYLEELGRWNTRFGFVKADSARDLVVKHVLDSLAAWRAVDREAGRGAVLDVGSGAGFPGLPLAIAMPGASFTLLERSAKKASFLKTCAIVLGLSNVAAMQDDLSGASGYFAVVTFRAVAPLDRFLVGAAGGLRFGCVIAYKGRIARAREEVRAIRARWGDGYTAEIEQVQVPFLDEERCLVVVRAGALLTNGSGQDRLSG